MKCEGIRREQELLRAIGKHAAIIKAYEVSIGSHVDQILGAIDLLRTHTKNRIAAYKAHVTMAKKKAPRLPAHLGGFGSDAVIIGDHDVRRRPQKGEVRQSP